MRGGAPQVRFEDAAKEKFDVVLDAIGGDYEERSLKVLKKGGHLAGVFTGHIIDQCEGGRRGPGEAAGGLGCGGEGGACVG